jgi:predicted ATPase
VLASVVATFGAGRLESLPTVLAGGPALLVVLGADRSPEGSRAALTWVRGRCPQVRILATGSRPLGLPGEHEWPVQPLDVPAPSATPAEVFGYPATRLFLDRLRLVRQRPVALDEAATLGTLVRRLGGVPLALELAAARGRVLELDEILARCADVSSAADPAAQSLREAVLASWRWLSPAEQECVRWLGVFQWRWSMSLAEALLADGPAGGVGGDVVALVDRLVGLGLAGVRSDPHEVRFWLLDAVRAVALEQAAATGVLTAARDRHAAVMADLVARTLAEAPDELPVAGSNPVVRTDSVLADLYAALDHLESDEAGADSPRVAGLRLDLKRWLQRRGV